MKVQKYCRGCWQYKYDFEIYKTKTGPRRGQRCTDCIARKKRASERRQAMIEDAKPCPIRAKELALIPNPFERTDRVIPCPGNVTSWGIV